MATPNPIADDNAGNAATFTRLVHSGNKAAVKDIYARVRYTGSAWEVHSGTDSNEIVSGNLAWSTNKLTIALTGYTVPPVVLCTQNPAATVPYVLQAGATSSSNVDVEFWDTAGAQVTTQATSMDFQLIVKGS